MGAVVWVGAPAAQALNPSARVNKSASTPRLKFFVRTIFFSILISIPVGACGDFAAARSNKTPYLFRAYGGEAATYAPEEIFLTKTSLSENREV
jgi:hypothetical protein